MKQWFVYNVALAAAFVAASGVALAQEDGEAKAAPPEGWEPIEIELPEPFFGGTPVDYWSPILEPQSFKDRDPFFAPPGVDVISEGVEVTSSFPEPLLGELEQIVDGDKSYAKTSLVELGEGPQWGQLDLGAPTDLYALMLWHFHEGGRVYFDVVVQLSNDPNFKAGVTTVYNNDHDNSAGIGVGDDKEYFESETGRLIPVEGVTAQYVRL